MTDHDKDKHLDELLHSALSAYSSAEPRPGLETKILAQVREATSRKELPKRNWSWLWAGAAAIAAVLLIALWISRHALAPAPTNNVVRSKEPPVRPAPKLENNTPMTAASPANQRRRQHGMLHSQIVAAAVPRLAVFPTPTPLSEQERLLLSYYAHTPRKELIAQSRPDEPSPVEAPNDQSNIAVPGIFVPQKSSNTR
jgi:hypothetical protein